MRTTMQSPEIKYGTPAEPSFSRGLLLWKGRTLPQVMFFLIPGLLLIVDLAFMGSGEWSEIIGFSVRKFLFLILICYSTLIWIMTAQITRALGAVAALALFILMWGLVVPTFYDTPFADGLSDSQLFLGLLFAPAISACVARTTSADTNSAAPSRGCDAPKSRDGGCAAHDVPSLTRPRATSRNTSSSVARL